MWAHVDNGQHNILSPANKIRNLWKKVECFHARVEGEGGKLFGAIWEKGSGIEYWTGLGKGGEPRKRKDGVTEAWISL